MNKQKKLIYDIPDMPISKAFKFAEGMRKKMANYENIEKVKEELRKTESALWKDIQRMKRIIHHLELKVRFAEQHATYADAFIDKLIKEKRTTIGELKQFKSSLDYKTKEELEDDMDGQKPPHYKEWRS